MTTLRIYDPVRLLEKDRELRQLQKRIDALMDRMMELREERRYYQKPRRGLKAAAL